MKHTGINFFSIFILLIFAGSVFYFFNTIHTDYTQGISRSEKIFKEISTLAEDSPEQIKPEMFTGENGILSAKYSKNNKTLIALPDEQTSTQVINSRLVKVFYKTIVLEEDTYELKIAFYILRPDVIYRAARNSFIVILAATLITIAMLIFISVKTKKLPDNKETESEADDFDEEFSIENTDETPFPEPEEKDENNQNQEDSAESDEQEEITESFQEQTEIPQEETIFETENKPEESQNLQESKEKIDETSIPEEIPSDVYYDEFKIMQNTKNAENPFSLKERINFELTKAVSDEEDFSLLLIEIKNSAKFTDIEKFLIDNYGKRNIFNYKDETFALLKENTNIDEAEDKAALIENNIRTAFDEPNMAIGISSRSIRTITADRLLAEAEEALNHAKTDSETRIVGFHVDVEKYREFLENSKNQENNAENE